MIYPNKINNTELIKIISPSNGVKSTKIPTLEKAISVLKKYNFDVCEDKYVRCSSNGVSASAEKRADELKDAILDTNIKGLVACSGGDYIIQILDYINLNIFKKNIKWIQGHSDITVLLYLLTTKYDIATIYSFNAKAFGDTNLPKSMIENDILFLKGDKPIQMEYGYKIAETNIECNWECITEFHTLKGRIIGGCLDSIKDIIGTKYDSTKKFIDKYKENGIIWYFDIAEMTNEDILRTMWQLKNADWFKYCKGILFGRIENEITYTNTTLMDAIKYCLSDFNIPILVNVDLGHTNPVLTIINGSIVKITKDKKFKLETYFE